jgi:multidrug efflux pump subunit AcrB
VAKYLFAPLAEAVIFAMIASYILSRTLVPTLAMYWMKAHGTGSHSGTGRPGRTQADPSSEALAKEEYGKPRKRFPLFDWLSGFHGWFNHQFEKFRESYRDLLSLGLRNGGKLVTLVLGFAAASALLYPFLGQNFFPSVDTGQFEMHVHRGSRRKSKTR